MDIGLCAQIFVFLCPVAAGVACKDEAGQPVDWWVDKVQLREVEVLFESAPTQINTGLSFLLFLLFFASGSLFTNSPSIKLARWAAVWITCIWTLLEAAGIWVNTWWTPVRELWAKHWTSFTWERPTRWDHTLVFFEIPVGARTSRSSVSACWADTLVRVGNWIQG